MALSPQEMIQAIVANLPQKTGKSVEDWVKTLKREGPKDLDKQADWLKKKRKLGTMTAQIILMHAEGDQHLYDDPDKLIDNLFRGPKKDLKKIYQRILAVTKKMPGAVAKPCVTYIPFYRRVQFCLVKPSGRASVVLQLAIGKDFPAQGRLEKIKAPDTRMTHRVVLVSPEDIDSDVRDWLKLAHAKSG